jgi:hypothetical protein
VVLAYGRRFTTGYIEMWRDASFSLVTIPPTRHLTQALASVSEYVVRGSTGRRITTMSHDGLSTLMYLALTKYS